MLKNTAAINSIFKWLLFALIVGVLVGVVDVIFGKVLFLTSNVGESTSLLLLYFLPFVGLLIHLMYQRYSLVSKKGMSLVFEVGRGQRKYVPALLMPLVIIATWLTHLFGGSAGREGVAVQIGATLSHLIGRVRGGSYFLNTKEERKKALIIGMAAGFSGLFQTPIAAIFFALELLVVGKISISILLPTTVASYTAYKVSIFLGLEKFSFLVSEMPKLDGVSVMKIICLGVIFGLVGRFFATGLFTAKSWFSKWNRNIYIKIFTLASLLALSLYLIKEGRYSGLGVNLIDASFYGEPIYVTDFLFKSLFTIATLAIGFQGGEVTPLFSIGASLGVVLAQFFVLPVTFTAAMGYIAVFSSATNTFLGPLFIAGEIFGFEIIPYAFLVLVVAYSSNGNKTIYTGQRID